MELEMIGFFCKGRVGKCQASHPIVENLQQCMAPFNSVRRERNCLEASLSNWPESLRMLNQQKKALEKTSPVDVSVDRLAIML